MKEILQNYIPYNSQEAHDKQIMLKKLEEKDILTRENETGHFSVSAWIVNREKTKVLMCYHLIYQSWSWLGGHLDGDDKISKVILKEIREESGLKDLKMLDDCFSVEILTVQGHYKAGQYVSSHLHYNITCLIEACEDEKLIVNEKENSQLQWFTFDELKKRVKEEWMLKHIYTKLNQKFKEEFYV